MIHTVGPVWNGGNRGEKDFLGKCYRNSMRIARENHLKSIAFPAISTGVYGYPKRKLLRLRYIPSWMNSRIWIAILQCL